MAEEEEGSRRSDGRAQRGSDPENGSTGAVLLQETAEKALEDYLGQIVNCILDNIRDKHLPSAKLLFELAARLRVEKEVPEAEYLSFAEGLWKAFLEEERVEEQAIKQQEMVGGE